MVRAKVGEGTDAPGDRLADFVSRRPPFRCAVCFRVLQRVRERNDGKVFSGRGGAEQPGEVAVSPDQIPIVRRASVHPAWSAAVLGPDGWPDPDGYRFPLPEAVRARDEGAEPDWTDRFGPDHGSGNCRAGGVARHLTTAMRFKAPNEAAQTDLNR